MKEVRPWEQAELSSAAWPRCGLLGCQAHPLNVSRCHGALCWSQKAELTAAQLPQGQVAKVIQGHWMPWQLGPLCSRTYEEGSLRGLR